MMDNAPEKALQMGIQFEQADCKNLRFSDHEFDLVSISFGIRNVIPPEEGIREMWRVLKPGGELFIIEFGRAKTWWMQIVYNFYSTKVIPFVGGLLSKNKQAYSYLDKSSRQFPCGRDFIKLLRNSAKFKSVEATPLSNGIAYIYRAVKK